MTSALFANLVLQQANMALMFLGKVAHPQSGKTMTDLEAARMFIDQLEMLETKTQGNLTEHEAGFLKQSLTSVRMAFVEAVDRGEQPGDPQSGATPTGTDAAAGGERQPQAAPIGERETSDSETDSRKKFTKKY
jgi:hypothetical protein